MSGPIVRSGPSTQFSANWGNVFGKKKGKSTQEKKTSQKKTSNKKSGKK